MIKILDSTLRDGGYIIDWNFGEKRILNIIKRLILAKIDFIELGFLVNKKVQKGQSLFNEIDDIKPYIKNFYNKNFCLMVKCGEYDIEKINANSIFIRYIFKKNAQKTALNECKKLIQKGVKLFVNPVFIEDYKSDEFYELVQKINLLNPYAISVVDSVGAKNEQEIKKTFLELDKITDKNTAFCFHCHNNKERAFISAKTLIGLELQRNIIIDSTLSGMGRGAGNICSELLAQYLNCEKNKDYKIECLEKVIDEELNPIFEKTPWGNSYPYYICANFKCHSEYAKYLIENNIKIADMEKIFSFIPDEKKSVYDENLIKNILSENIY